MVASFRCQLLARASIIATLFAASAGAHAQAQVDQAEPPPPEGASPQQAEVQNEGLAEIVVTAQRRAENLQRAAIPVSAVTGDSLVAAGVVDVTNMSKLVPSLVVQPTLGSSTNFYLRGVGSFAANAFSENPIAFSFNGVYVGRASAPLGTFYDLERVEVLKGPQGTLYGRNATGGAINVLPRQPSLSGAGGEITAEYGNLDSKRLIAAVNLPLGDSVAVRLAGQYADRDGFLSDGYGDDGGHSMRASILFEPSPLFKMTFVADYTKLDSRGIGAVLVRGPSTPTAPEAEDRIGGSDPRSTAELNRFPQVRSGLVTVPRGDGYVRGEFWGVSATITGDMGFADLTVIPAFRKSRPDYLTYNGGYFARNDETVKQMSVEARLSSNGDTPLRYVAGIFFFDEQQEANNLFSQGPVSTTNFIARIDNRSIAGFGQLTYSITPALRLVAGGRYTREDKRQNTLLRQATPANPNPSFRTVLGEVSFDSFTYKAGVEFDAGPKSLIYANVSTGFKSGGFFVGIRNNTFEPEKLTAYTIGTKNRFLNNRLQVNLEAFWWDYRDQQIAYTGPVETSPGIFGAGGITANAGRVRIRGAEAELRFQASPEDLFGIDVQYLDSQYRKLGYLAISQTGVPPRSGCEISPDTSLPVVAPARLFQVECAGKPAINAPKWSANVSYERTFRLGGDYDLVALARTRLESSRFMSLEFLPEQRQDSYMTSDVSLTLEGPANRWAVTAFVNNLEDATLYGGSVFRPVISVVYNTLRLPRTYGARLTVRF